MRDWLLRLAVVASLLALALSVLVVWRVVAEREWDPLGPYPEQTVQATAGRVDWTGETYSGATVSIPAVRFGEPVTVVGTKCTTEPVTIQGTKSWTSRDPAGFTASEGGSVVQRDIGCRTATYEDRLPADLAAWVDDELGHHPFVVLIGGGCETPVDNERAGKVECWRTELFAVVR